MQKVRPHFGFSLRTGLTAATAGLAFGLTALSSPVDAQQDGPDEVAQPIVQAVPNLDSMNLNAALTRLGRNPRDLDALVEAGNAALTIGDVDAAVGFFSRADQVAPGNAKVKGGLAGALVHSGNPYDAIPLFDEAERGGIADPKLGLERGLAYDLVGDNATAQSYYRQVLAAGPNDEASRRLAVSLAIVGDKRGSASALSPLLMRRDMAAWRARAFSLAIMEQTDEAVAVVNSTLPPALSSSIGPYLRYMPRLTPAQQAAAANFGQFPRASEIGRDDPRIARYSTTSRRPSLASAEASLIPKGEPLGKKRRGKDSRSADLQADRQNQGGGVAADTVQSRVRQDSRVSLPEPVRVAAAAPSLPVPVAATPVVTPVFANPPAPAPVVAATSLTVSPAVPIPQVTSAQPVQANPVSMAPAPAPAPVVIVQAPTAAAVPVTPAPVAPAAAPAAITLPPTIAPTANPVAVTTAAVPLPPIPIPADPAPVSQQPAAQPPLPPQPVRTPSLAEAFSDLAKPPIDMTPSRGAVDIRRIRPAREGALAAAPAKPQPPSHPSRIWVQLATGRDKAALGFDWRRITRQADLLFRGKRGSISNWGQTNRLLTGPFESEAAANAFLGQLRRANISGAFVWNSPAGQVVDAIVLR